MESSNPPTSPQEQAIVQYNARLGMAMFLVYLAIYAAFVGLCTFKLDTMSEPLGGVSVAIWYGFTLIGLAFVLAATFLFLCKK